MPRTVTIHHPELKIKKKPWGTKKEDVIKRGRDCTTTTHRRQFCCCSCVCVVEERTIDGGYSGPHHRWSCLWTPNASSIRSAFETFDGCAVFSSTRSIYLSSSCRTWTPRGLLRYPAGIMGRYFPPSFSSFVGSILSCGLTVYIRRLRLRLRLLLL